MELVVISHKVCWPSPASESGYATDGGFALQMEALARLFDATTLMVPCEGEGRACGEVPISGYNLAVVPLPVPRGKGLTRKLQMLAWTVRSLPRMSARVRAADAVHAPIPGDVGTIGLLLALLLGKPLFVRHCGDWTNPRTVAERGWRWLLERIAGGKNVVMATGWGEMPPSARNPNIEWIFSTSLSLAGFDRYRQERQLEEGRKVRLLHVGRQEPGKGTDVLIKSVFELRARGRSVTADIVGDGSALSGLKELAERLGVSEQVRFHGKLSHDGVMAVMATADLFCFPTCSEGFPKVVVEAMASGLPVITTPVSALPHLVGEGGGVVIRHPESNELTAAVEHCTTDPRRYAEMSRRATETASRYTLERWSDQIYQRLKAASR